MSSTVLTTDTSLSTERFSIKIRLRSLGDGCGGGTMTVAIDLLKEFSVFDKCENGIFSFVQELLSLVAIEVVSSGSYGTKNVYTKRFYS